MVFSGTNTMIVVIIVSLSLLLFLALIKFLEKLWWNPSRVQKMMAAQGIKGPPYKFLHGNIKDIFRMRNESLGKPMNGLTHDMFPRMQPHISKWIKQYGENFLNWFGPTPMLVITEPELMKEVLNNKEKCFIKVEPEGYLKLLLGDGLVTSEGEKWAKMRRLANNAFHGESLKGMFPAVVDTIHLMLETWKQHEGEEIEVFSEFKMLTSEVISRTAFGSGYMEGRNIFEMLSQLAILTSRDAFKTKFPVISKIWKTADDIEAHKLEKGIHDAIIRIIKKREEKVLTGELESYENDFLGLLVTASYDEDEKKRITVNDLVDECKTFYVAGHETTNTVLSWTVLLLAIHPEWQERAREEVIDVFGNHDPDYDGIGRLKKMTMIIDESMRLYTPVINITRKVNKPTRLGNKLLLPKNMQLFVPTLKLHHDPQIWGEDVSQFKPERFSEGIAKATNNNSAAFMPFGLGPRACVGMNFALIEAKAALSMILQRYTFSVSPGYVHSPTQVLTLRPKHGVQVIIRPL